jgi:hypothetical protein
MFGQLPFIFLLIFPFYFHVPFLLVKFWLLFSQINIGSPSEIFDSYIIKIIEVPTLVW